MWPKYVVWPKTTVRVTGLKFLRYETIHVLSRIKYFSDVPAITKFSAVHVPVILKFYSCYKTLILYSILFTTYLFWNFTFRSESYFLGLSCDFLISFFLPFCCSLSILQNKTSSHSFFNLCPGFFSWLSHLHFILHEKSPKCSQLND